MSKHESGLRRQLQREAAETKPEFSEALHRRILAAVERGRMPPALPEPSAQPPQEQHWRERRHKALLRRRLLAVSAAACFACVIFLGWRLREMREGLPAGGENVAASSMADLLLVDDLTRRAAIDFDRLVASVDYAPQSAALLADARRAAESLLERLPYDLDATSTPGKPGR